MHCNLASLLLLLQRQLSGAVAMCIMRCQEDCCGECKRACCCDWSLAVDFDFFPFFSFLSPSSSSALVSRFTTDRPCYACAKRGARPWITLTAAAAAAAENIHVRWRTTSIVECRSAGSVLLLPHIHTFWWQGMRETRRRRSSSSPCSSRCLRISPASVRVILPQNL